MFALIRSRSGSQSAMLLRWALQGHHDPLVLSWSSLIQLQVTYGWTTTFLSSQGTEVNKNSTSYTSVVSPQKKKKKKKKEEEKERKEKWRKSLGPD